MRTTLIPDRWQRIIDIVALAGGAATIEIAAELGVSEVTIRRDLRRIEARGLILRTRGGAEPAPDVALMGTYGASLESRAIDKLAIGRCAAALLRPGETIMIDGGATTLQVARHLPAGSFTIVTTSLDIANLLARREDVRLVLVGGDVNALIGTTTGPTAQEQLLQMGAHKAILGADAISPETGISSPNSLTAANKKAMALRSSEVIVVADSSKIGRFALYHVPHREKIKVLVTDARAPLESVQQFRAAGINVMIAAPK
ncbi:MAG: DeoR/GlpR family DNA-binding transcription regulator [Capsulimonadaceae bacterium]|nr:DeoR/GlpR family DNA-binding transcription regulator [Capsulimonadaceae bacterium]